MVKAERKESRDTGDLKHGRIIGQSYSGMFRPTGVHMEEDCGVMGGDQELVICFGTHNIRNGRNGGIDLVLHRMA